MTEFKPGDRVMLLATVEKKSLGDSVWITVDGIMFGAYTSVLSSFIQPAPYDDSELREGDLVMDANPDNDGSVWQYSDGGDFICLRTEMGATASDWLSRDRLPYRIRVVGNLLRIAGDAA